MDLHVTLPTQQLLDALTPLPVGMSAAVWDLDPATADQARARDAQYVVLPYFGDTSRYRVLADLPALRTVQTMSTGYDDVDPFVPDGVSLVSAAGVHDAVTAELTIGLLLASLRGIDDAIRDGGQQRWNPRIRGGLVDSRVLLLGVGGIGQAIARRLLPFEVDLTLVGRTARDLDLDGVTHRVHAEDELLGLLPDHDVVVLACPLTESTRGLVDAEFLAAMPDGALLCNIARGKVVDTDALLAELTTGRLRAALDVVDPEPLPADHPLWHAPGTVLVPHIGGASRATRRRYEALLADQLGRLSRGEALRNVVR